MKETLKEAFARKKAEKLQRKNSKAKQDYTKYMAGVLGIELSPYLLDEDVDPLIEFSEHESNLGVGFYSSVLSDFCAIGLRVIGNSPLTKNELPTEAVLLEAKDIYGASEVIKNHAVIFRSDGHILAYTDDPAALELASRLSFFISGKMRVICVLSDYIHLKGGMHEETICAYSGDH
jgi:hypothetical protein